MSNDLAVYRVHGLHGNRPVTGSDSCIITVPEGLYVRITPDAEPALDVRQLGRLLRDVSERSAHLLGVQLHHAEWVITDDPDEIEKRGMHDTPDCTSCRASVDQAHVYLIEHGKPLLVGTLYWAG